MHIQFVAQVGRTHISVLPGEQRREHHVPDDGVFAYNGCGQGTIAQGSLSSDAQMYKHIPKKLEIAAQPLTLGHELVGPMIVFINKIGCIYLDGTAMKDRMHDLVIIIAK